MSHTETSIDDERLEAVLSECIQAYSESGPAALEALLAAHPLLSVRLRERLGALAKLGFLEDGSANLPKTIGPYSTLKRLGRGGMGIVYLAIDASGQRVAVKLAPVTIDPRAREAARFEREMRAIAELDHPSIVPVLQTGAEGGRAWFSMPHIAGATLGEVLDGARAEGLCFADLDARLLAELVAQASAKSLAGTHAVGTNEDRIPDAVASERGTEASSRTWVEAVVRHLVEIALALHHAHERGILHRDVKPANILIGVDGHARLFDFGLARVEHDLALTQSGDFTGTAYYVSPEQARGSVSALDRRTDVFSLGVTLYEVLTLRRPFEGASTAEVLRAIQAREPTPLRRRNALVPRDLETVCMTALEKDPRRRYATAAEMAADLQRFLAFQPVQARPVGSVRRIARWARHNPAPATVALLGLVIAIGLPTGLGVANSAIRAQRDAAEGNARRADANAREATRQARTSAEVVDFLVDLFHAPPQADPQSRSARDMLERGAQRAQSGIGTDLVVRAALLEAIGRVYQNLGLLDRAVANFDRSFALRQRELGEDHPDVARALHVLGALHLELGNVAVARAVLDRGLSSFVNSGTVETLACVRLRGSMAQAYRLDHEPRGARAALEAAGATLARLGAEASREAASIDEHFGDLDLAEGRFASACERFARASRVLARDLSPDLEVRARLYVKSASAEEGAGRPDRAAVARREAQELRSRSSQAARGGRPAVSNIPWTEADDARLLLEFEPADQSAFDTAFQRGITALQSKNSKQAALAFERCCALRSRDPVSAYNLACALAQEGAIDAGIEGLARAVELGFGAAEDRIEVLLRDADMAPLRADPRWRELLERMRFLRESEAARSRSTPLLPTGLAPVMGWPLLVVLCEPAGPRLSLSEDAWVRLARGSNAALLRVVRPRATALRWVEDRRDFVERPWSYQEPVLEAVQRACEHDTIDPLRIVLVGEGSAALPAFDLALRASGIFRAVMALDGPIDTGLARENAETAAASGLSVWVWRRESEPIDTELAGLFRRWFDRFGFEQRGSFEWIAPDAVAESIEAHVGTALSNSGGFGR